MKAAVTGFNDCLASLVWTKACLESRKNQGGISWLECQKIDETLSFINKTIAQTQEYRDRVRDISDTRGPAVGGLVRLSERGRREYRPVLGDDVEQPLVVLQVKPTIVAKSSQGVKCTLLRTQIEVE